MGLLTPLIRTQRIRQVLPHLHGDILDVGCDQALLLQTARDRITTYTGIERSPQRVALLARRYPDAAFVQRNLEEDTLDLGRRFDVILLLAVIEHIHNQEHLMGEVLNALKPAGRIVVTTPTPFGNYVVHRLGAFLGLFSRDAMHAHVAIYARARFLRLAQRFGLRVAVYRRFQLCCNQFVILERLEEAREGGQNPVSP